MQGIPLEGAWHKIIIQVDLSYINYLRIRRQERNSSHKCQKFLFILVMTFADFVKRCLRCPNIIITRLFIPPFPGDFDMQPDALALIKQIAGNGGVFGSKRRHKLYAMFFLHQAEPCLGLFV